MAADRKHRRIRMLRAHWEPPHGARLENRTAESWPYSLSCAEKMVVF